jgi:hypothetical protein
LRWSYKPSSRLTRKKILITTNRNRGGGGEAQAEKQEEEAEGARGGELGTRNN